MAENGWCETAQGKGGAESAAGDDQDCRGVTMRELQRLKNTAAAKNSERDEVTEFTVASPWRDPGGGSVSSGFATVSWG